MNLYCIDIYFAAIYISSASLGIHTFFNLQKYLANYWKYEQFYQIFKFAQENIALPQAGGRFPNRWVKPVLFKAPSFWFLGLGGPDLPAFEVERH